MATVEVERRKPGFICSEAIAETANLSGLLHLIIGDLALVEELPKASSVAIERLVLTLAYRVETVTQRHPVDVLRALAVLCECLPEGAARV